MFYMDNFMWDFWIDLRLFADNNWSANTATEKNLLIAINFCK